jgi:hypothetical protein
MIRLLRQKAIDKVKLANERKLGEKEIAVFNRLEARGDPDRELHNEKIYEPYLSKFVKRGTNMEKYREPEMIKPNYVTPEQVRKMIDAKYKRGNFNIKSEDELKKLYEVAENVFNNMEDPKNSLNTVSGNYDRIFTDKLYEISSKVGPQQLQNIVANNIKIENENNLNVPSTSSSLAAFPSIGFKEEEKMPGEYEDESRGESETETETATASESDILPEDPNRTVQDNKSSSNRSIARLCTRIKNRRQPTTYSNGQSNGEIRDK